MSGSVLLLNFAYVVLVSATLFRAVMSIRIALIVGAVSFVAYGLVVGNGSMAFWNLVTGSLHAIQLARHIRARRSVMLSDVDEAFRLDFCPEIDRFDFFALWSMGREVTCDDQQLTWQGKDQTALMLLLDGSVRVDLSTGSATRHAGSFVGELSYLSGEPASADVFTVGSVRFREWDQMQLRALEQLNPASSRALRSLMTLDLAAKMNR